MTVRLTLKPSILVGAGISRSGGIFYERDHKEQTVEGTKETKRWETTRRVPNIDQLQLAESTARECRRMLSKVCCRMAFGWVCPKDQEAALDGVIEEIREKVAKTNAGLSTCTLRAAFVKGVIASDDAEAVGAIQAEIQAFLTELKDALDSYDPATIRQVLLTAKGLDTVLEANQSAALKAAVSAAKKAAKTIRKEVEKKGRMLEVVKQEIDLSPVDTARTMFLELDESEAA